MMASTICAAAAPGAYQAEVPSSFTSSPPPMTAVPGPPRRDHDHIGLGALLVAVRADDVRLVAEHRSHLVDVERLALRQPFLDVDQDDVGVVARRQHLGASCADSAGADHGDFASLAQTRAPILSMIASATSLVPTAVGSSREGFMS